MNQDNNKNNQNRNRSNIPSNFHNYQKMLSDNKLSNFSKKTHLPPILPKENKVNEEELNQSQEQLEQSKQSNQQKKLGTSTIFPKAEPVKGTVEFVKAAAKKNELDIKEGSKGCIFNADAVDLIKLIDFGSSKGQGDI